MMSQTSRWRDAAIVLGRDPTAKVTCPVCGEHELQVRDVYPFRGADMFERYLECPSCKSRNIMRMKNPPPCR
jgi:DNA-directed RNA polymerase subunit RPC12/RpoP